MDTQRNANFYSMVFFYIWKLFGSLF